MPGWYNGAKMAKIDELEMDKAIYRVWGKVVLVGSEGAKLTGMVRKYFL